MSIRITGAAAVAALLLASPVAAQEAGPRPEVVEAAAELTDRLSVLMAELGADATDLPRDQLVRAVEAALPLGEADGTSWASGMQFSFDTILSEGEVEPDPGGRVVLTDARACLATDEVAQVVHFERITRDDLRGHRCVVVHKGEPDNVWVLRSDTFAEGPGRRFTAHYAMAVTVGGDPDRAQRMLEERLIANVQLSGVMAIEALDLFLLKPRDGGAITQADADARVARMGERLDQLTEAGEGR